MVKCFKCTGPFHPATGHVFAQGVEYCGRCAREFYAFFKGRMVQMSRPGRDFAMAASTSIRPPITGVAHVAVQS